MRDLQPIFPVVALDPWVDLRAFTPARLALGRAGAALPTREVLRLGLDHARARDAVAAALETGPIVSALDSMGVGSIRLDSACPDRATFLRRPDLGRRLSRPSREALAACAGPRADLALVIADGLSASAVQKHAVPLLQVLVPELRGRGWSFAPAAIVRQGRVALGDEVGQHFGVRLVLVLIGERPGLSSPDSLGAYLTFAPVVGRTDAERNCVSNIRAGGLPPARAARTLAWLIASALERSLTGTGLKDESAALLPPGTPAEGAPPLPVAPIDGTADHGSHAPRPNPR